MMQQSQPINLEIESGTGGAMEGMIQQEDIEDQKNHKTNSTVQKPQPKMNFYIDTKNYESQSEKSRDLRYKQSILEYELAE